MRRHFCWLLGHRWWKPIGDWCCWDCGAPVRDRRPRWVHDLEAKAKSLATSSRLDGSGTEGR